MTSKSQNVIYKNPSELIPYVNNSRLHSAEQINQVASSIKEFGFLVPILIDASGMIIAGHCRAMAAQKLKLTEVPCIMADHLTATQVKAYVIADNKLSLNSSWDEELLKLEIDFLTEEGFDITVLGFSDDELTLFEDVKPFEGQCDEDDCPDVPVNPITKKGDIWLLGEHRLLCGDSTSITNVEKLMNGEKVGMVFTDPPYGINEKTARAQDQRTKTVKSKNFSKIIGDDSIETAVSVYSICNDLSDIVCYWGGNYYAHKLPPSPCWLVWDKRIEEKQRDVNSDCELAYVKHPRKESVRIFRHLWKGMIKESEHGQARVHPTQKPIALAEWCLEELDPKGSTVLDLFGGSGSTLIACEKLKRKCYVMELDENYCDVIVKRWETFTGKKAIKYTS